LYKFILSPMAQWLVDTIIPLWMAPNVVTTIGLLFNIASAVLVVLFNPELSATGPHVAWLAGVSAVGMFLYQTFDNMDGKQARKTGSQSPLGLLFDHGCDALNAGLSVLPVASSLGLGWSRKLLFNMIPLIPFYVQTWELFYVKSMILPIINGPSEGLVIACSMMLVTYYTGSATWFHTSQTVFGHSVVPYDFMVLFGFAGAGITLIIQCLNVYRALKRDLKGSDLYSGIVSAFSNLVVFTMFIGSVLLWCTSPGTIALAPRFRWWTLLLVSSVFVEIVSHINLMHITMEPALQPWKRYSVLSTVYLALCTMPAVKTHLPFFLREESVLVLFSLITAYVTFRTLHLMNTEVAQVLGIQVFLIGPPLKKEIVKKHSTRSQTGKKKE